MLRSKERQQRILEENGDYDENYEFQGATLKISSDETTDRSDKENFNVKSQLLPHDSAILPESKLTSPQKSLPDALTNQTSQAQTKDFIKEGTMVEEPIPKPKVGSPINFFSFRTGLYDHAINDCINMLLRSTNDTNVIGNWLLTEISHWDHEREKIFILTPKTLLEVKYDFIALRILQFQKINLCRLDLVTKGQLKYPESSLVPRLEGITNGVTSLISGGLFSGNRSKRTTTNNENKTMCGGMAVTKRFDFSNFKPIERSETGIRLNWNRGAPVSLLSTWNPFAKDIPWKTISDHPLYNYKDPYNSATYIQEGLEKNRNIYSVETLYESLERLFNEQNENISAPNSHCIFKEEPIIVQNYVGIGAMIHNKNNFGFFKVRGKFSF